MKTTEHNTTKIRTNSALKKIAAGVLLLLLLAWIWPSSREENNSRPLQRPTPVVINDPIVVDQVSLNLAKELNAKLRRVAVATAVTEIERVTNDFWSSQAVEAYYSKLTGLYDNSMNPQAFTRLHAEAILLTESEANLVLAKLNARIEEAVLTSMREVFRDTPGVVAMKVAANRFEHATAAQPFTMGNQIIAQLRDETLSVLNNRPWISKVSAVGSTEYKSLIASSHQRVLTKAALDVARASVSGFELPEAPESYRIKQSELTKVNEARTFDSMLLLAQRELLKRRIAAESYAKTMVFLKSFVTYDRVGEYRDCFYGGIDNITTLYHQWQGTAKYNSVCRERFVQEVFTEEDLQRFTTEISNEIAKQSTIAINEYNSFATEFVDQALVEYPLEIQAAIDSNLLQLPHDKVATIAGYMDLADSAIISAQIAGILFAPATGGTSLIVTAAATAWDGVMIARDAVVMPEHDAQQVISLANHMQTTISRDFLIANGSNTGVFQIIFGKIDKTFKNHGNA